MAAFPHCNSTWQQMPSEPIIICARKDGHAGMHYNSRAQRQWTTAQELPAATARKGTAAR